eukprot:scaffold13882_cov31-Tisochrysis_lutea.AAC.5
MSSKITREFDSSDFGPPPLEPRIVYDEPWLSGRASEGQEAAEAVSRERSGCSLPLRPHIEVNASHAASIAVRRRRQRWVRIGCVVPLVRNPSIGPVTHGQNISCCSVRGMREIRRIKSFGCSRANCGKHRTTGSTEEGRESTRPDMTASTNSRTQVRRPIRRAVSSAVSPWTSGSSPIFVEVAAAGDDDGPPTRSDITAGSVTTSVAYCRNVCRSRGWRQLTISGCRLKIDARQRSEMCFSPCIKAAAT